MPVDADLEQALLTQWHDLMRTGYFAWGFNLGNPNPPFFHSTERGRRALERLSRDPANPAGYLAHLRSVGHLNPVAHSYLTEGLDCYGSGFYKAAAVMIGAASESLIIEIRDAVKAKLIATAVPEPKGLSDWRVKTMLDSLHSLLEAKKSGFPRDLREDFDACFLAFAQQIRSSRNDAGHPTSVDPVREEAVHASYLVFPDLAKLSSRICSWVATSWI